MALLRLGPVERDVGDTVALLVEDLGCNATPEHGSGWGAYRASSRRAIESLCTSSGPSASRSVRAWAYIAASGKSSLTPAAAVHLDRAVDHLAGDLGGRDLDRRDLDPGALVAGDVHQPRGLQGQQPRLLDLDPRLGDPVADHALPGKRLAEREARRGRARTSGRRPARPCRSRACSGGCDPGRAAPGRSRTRALLAEHVRRRHADVVEQRPRSDRRGCRGRSRTPAAWRSISTPGVSSGTRIMLCWR